MKKFLSLLLMLMISASTVAVADEEPTVVDVSPVETLEVGTTPISTGDVTEGETVVGTTVVEQAPVQTATSGAKIPLDMYKDYVKLELTADSYIDGDTAMVPIIEIAWKLGLDAYYDKTYNSVCVSIDDKEILYNLDTTYATINGVDTFLDKAPVFVGWTIMAPLKPLLDVFDVDYQVQDEGAWFNINVGHSEAAKKYVDRITGADKVNGVSSRTNYLVWVSKYEYKVRVYEGEYGNWKLVRECPCSIGAPGTPTITGKFEYIDYQNYWDYGSYYCGPIVRFYNGYALHSTLQYWNGGAYDGRLGMQISHGCVRMDPPDIKWIANTIPLYTRIYITN